MLWQPLCAALVTWHPTGRARVLAGLHPPGDPHPGFAYRLWWDGVRQAPPEKAPETVSSTEDVPRGAVSVCRPGT